MILGVKSVPSIVKVVKTENTGPPTSQPNSQNKPMELNDLDDDDLIASMETDMWLKWLFINKCIIYCILFLN